jgi:hypothetical protein
LISAAGIAVAHSFHPSFFAASTPNFASSITTHSEGSTPNLSAAFKNISGSGFPFFYFFPACHRIKISF